MLFGSPLKKSKKIRDPGFEPGPIASTSRLSYQYTHHFTTVELLYWYCIYISFCQVVVGHYCNWSCCQPVQSATRPHPVCLLETSKHWSNPLCFAQCCPQQANVPSVPPELPKKRRLAFSLVASRCRAAPNELDPQIGMFAAMFCRKDKANGPWQRGAKCQNMG